MLDFLSPTYLPPFVCMLQIDSQFFWAGVPWEFESRQFVAQTLNRGFKTNTSTPQNVIYANAMEGIGFSQVRQQ